MQLSKSWKKSDRQMGLRSLSVPQFNLSAFIMKKSRPT